ncbi:hypothetical protein DNJ72_04010 [Prochlorococcus marinus XMU1403]|uniref:DEAD/DEAH box helicase family protein n=1 Tax=Prochlorococcus marinus TaxID=1219 RepID=UPI000D9E3624|nr:DEAD/DEAH box helicase family protein [Prochlorococcus marinus]MBW3049251.1 hypothetical protein [Prochlorococcus marinus str. MU1403]PYE02211.1 hypothetical protein DNJ72_04010 [Prochlorococcus marinus XMU1403]
MKSIRKPSWLSMKVFIEFQQKFQNDDGSYNCSEPGCTRHADTIDHIRPRTAPEFTEPQEFIDENGRTRKRLDPNAAHKLENLQPMCRSHNSSKGTKDDNYWDRTLYFDSHLNTSKLRASQHDYIYRPLVDAAPHVLNRISEVNGKLLIFSQCTGAGKTIGKFVLPFGINHGFLKNSPAYKPPRADKVLLCVKDQTLRKQLANELRTEPVELGIINQAPKVFEAESSDELETYSRRDNVQFVVICAQLLWDRMNSAIAGNRVQLLSRFPVVIFDEMHYATEKIRQIVHQATNSLVFGLTATPVQGNGNLIEDSVGISTYGYLQACRNDNSMKSLGEAVDSPRASIYPNFEDIIEEVSPEEVTDINGEILQPEDLGYSLPAALNVANKTAEKVWFLDRHSIETIPSGHRRLTKLKSEDYPNSKLENVVPDIPYWSHAILRCKDIPTAEHICQHLNEKFEQNRNRYPIEKGWKAEVAHSGNKDHKAITLDEKTHPWFWSKNNGGKISENSARFLVVSSMATEGVNNRFCNVVGWAKPPQTMRNIVQANGRAFRSVVEIKDSEIHVPYSHLDRGHLITHYCWGEGETFEERQEKLIQSLRFFLNPDQLTGMTTFNTWLEEGDNTSEINWDDPESGITLNELGKVISHLASLNRKGEPLRIGKLYELIGAHGEKRQKGVRDLAQGLFNHDPETITRVQRRLGRLTEVRPLESIPTVETVNTSVSDEAAVDLITNIEGLETLEEKFANDMAGLTATCLKLTSMIRGNFYQHQEVEMHESITDVMKQIVNETIRSYGIETIKNEVYSETYRAAKIILGMDPNEVLGEKTRFNIPAVILHFKNTKVKAQIQGHCLRVLHDRGFLEEEGLLLGLNDLEEGQ